MVQGAGCKFTIGVYNDNDLWRVRPEVVNAEVECKAFTQFGWIYSLNYFDALRPCHNGCVVRTIVGNHEQSIARKQLGLDIGECRQNSRAFIMRRDEHGNRPANLMVRAGRALPSGRDKSCNDLDKKHQDGNSENSRND